MFAEVALITPTAAADEPLVYYQPEPTADLPVLALDMRVTQIIGGYGVTFALKDCATLPASATAVPQTWRYDFQTPRLHQEYDIHDGLALPTCDDRDPGARLGVDLTVAETMPFWIGPATLIIGYDPATDRHFPGAIDSVLLDPVDSKTVKR